MMNISLLINIMLGVAVLAEGVTIFFLFRKLRQLPSEDFQIIDDELGNLSLKIEKLENDLELYINDIYDKFEGHVRTFARRANSREKDINTGSPLKKQGMISLAEAKKHGLIK